MKFVFSCLVLLCLAQTIFGQVKKPVSSTKKIAVSPTQAAITVKKITAPVSKEKLVEITTNYGTMVAKLYDSTPLHRDNFLKLVKDGFYDSLLFHRIINQFMVQGGDPTSKNAPITVTLGSGSAPGDRIPAEFKPMFFHKKGALAAARDNNAQKASSNCQFYIVQGKIQTEADVENIKKTNPAAYYKNSQLEIYKRIGGTPFLDQNYTVFGEVISGLEVIDKIAAAATVANNRPAENITMKMRLLN